MERLFSGICLKSAMSPTDVLEFFQRLAEKNPHPTTELYYTTPFNLLVAVVLSAQMTDKGVNKVTSTLFDQITSPQDILDMGLPTLEQHLKTIGLFRTKAKHLMALSHIILHDFGGQVPSTLNDLIRLPGVGVKTANVILNIVYGIPTIAVDTHIFRVSNRTGLAKGRTPLEVEKKLNVVVPKEYKYNAHHWLILHGRYVCKARTPLCPTCIVRDLCAYPDKTKD